MLKESWKTTLEIQGTQSENWPGDRKKKVQLTLSQGKKKKGDEVEDEDDDVVRTSVSQDRVSISVSGAHMISSPGSLEPVQAVKK